ncbi:MAG: hypothetical protein R3F37_03935 [Candidatus Competibacteraceae bacterium]
MKHFKSGDEVFYSPEIFGGQGSYAEYHVADESIVALKPRNLNFLEAACRWRAARPGTPSSSCNCSPATAC